MIRVLQDLLGSKDAPARQIFHSILSNKSRKLMMLACLQKAKVTARKSALYDAMITQFSDINTMRNKFLHSLWYTVGTENLSPTTVVITSAMDGA